MATPDRSSGTTKGGGGKYERVELGIDELPAELRSLSTMPEKELASIDEKLRIAATSPEATTEFNKVVSEALWDCTLVEERMPKVASGVWAALSTTVRGPGGLDNIEEVVRPGLLAMHAFAGLSFGPSCDEVRLRRAEPGRPCAVVCGFAGASVDRMEPQARLYRSRGFNVISTSMCSYPMQLRQRQMIKLGREIRHMLSEGSKLLLHCSSGQGVTLGGCIVTMWIRNEPPFDNLPPLEDCLAGLVVDCTSLGHKRMPVELLPADAPRQLFTPTKENTLAIIEADEANQGAYIALAAATQTLDDFLKLVKGTSWHAASSANVVLRKLLRLYLATVNIGAQSGFYGGRLGHWGPPVNSFIDFDKLASKPVPRLFLYGDADTVYPAFVVEESIDDAWKSFIDMGKRPQIMCRVIPKGKHMVVWQTDYTACISAVADFLRLAKLEVPPY